MRVRFSCVLDQKPKFANQAVVWAASLLAYGAQSADSLIVHHVGECDPECRKLFEAWGIETRRVERFDRRSGPSNKLAQLESESLWDADYAVLCDCDLAFCGDISPWIGGDSIRACIAAAPGLSGEGWSALFREAHLELPAARRNAVPSNIPTLPTYCNGGLYILPQAGLQRLREAWPRWVRWLLDRPWLSRPYFADQVAFAMACVELELSIDHLPIELNFQTTLGRAKLRAATGRSDFDPLVLHYHQMSPKGFLPPSAMESVNRQVRRVNALITDCRNGAFSVPAYTASADPSSAPVSNPVRRTSSDGFDSGTVADPVFILSPPLSAASDVASMLGQHPQLYTLPETHLLLAETLREWWDLSAQSSFGMAEGLLRAVAELEFGGQTEANVKLASGWLLRRRSFTTAFILETLAAKVHPRTIVEKSPSVVFDLESMQRAHRMFPQARFIHVVQQPQSYAEAVAAAVRAARIEIGYVPQWLHRLACFSGDGAQGDAEEIDVNPQQAWYALNRNICTFLESIPDHQAVRIRSESALNGAGTGLSAILDWLGLRTDSEILEAVRHPERSPYACLGPPGAQYGDDPAFLGDPLRSVITVESAAPPASWHAGELTSEVQDLAGEFGYV
jgi:hypothetical protein